LLCFYQVFFVTIYFLQDLLQNSECDHDGLLLPVRISRQTNHIFVLYRQNSDFFFVLVSNTPPCWKWSWRPTSRFSSRSRCGRSGQA
jgi:hypothetical protein